jgi:hypothetical protein
MEWHHHQSPWKKTFRKPVSEQGYDNCPQIEGVIPVDVMPRGETVNSDALWQELRKCFKQVQPNKDQAEILL